MTKRSLLYAPILPGILFLFLWLSSLSLSAQQSEILERYIQEGIEHNLSVQRQDLELQKSREQLKQAKAFSMPNLRFEANYTLAAGGRKLDFPIGDLLNPVYSTLNQLTQSNAFPPVENAEIQFLPNNFHETKIGFAYPLYNTDIRYNRQIQNYLLQSRSALGETEKQSLRYDITSAYIGYLQALEGEKIWRNARNVLLELKRFNESLVRNNVATRDVVTTADYEISKVDNEIFGLQTKAASARAYFNFLVSGDLQKQVIEDSLFLRSTVPVYKLEDLIPLAMDKRQEISALQSLVAAGETNVKRNSANLKLPDLYIGGSVGFQGFQYKFNREQAYALAQIGLTYSLYDGGLQRSKTQESRLDALLTKNQVEQVQQQIALEIITAWNELEAARFAFQTAQKNVEAAEAIFRIVNNKYRAGQVLLIEFLQAQNRVTTAQLQQLIAWSDVLRKEAALKRAAGM